jgi:hypothetical protein
MSEITGATPGAVVLVHGGFVDGLCPGRGRISGCIDQGSTAPSRYLVATDDKMIPLPAQQFMSKRAGSTVIEAAGRHAIYVSKPEAVAALIKKAAQGVKLAT